MASRFLLLLTLFLIGNCIEEEEDDIKTTMEQFSGYPAAADPSHSIPPVDSLALQQQIDELSTFSDSPAPSVTRILYAHNDVLARRFIKNLMGRAGLSVREDAVGNIFGRWSVFLFYVLSGLDSF